MRFQRAVVSCASILATTLLLSLGPRRAHAAPAARRRRPRARPAKPRWRWKRRASPPPPAAVPVTRRSLDRRAARRPAERGRLDDVPGCTPELGRRGRRRADGRRGGAKGHQTAVGIPGALRPRAPNGERGHVAGLSRRSAPGGAAATPPPSGRWPSRPTVLPSGFGLFAADSAGGRGGNGRARRRRQASPRRRRRAAPLAAAALLCASSSSPGWAPGPRGRAGCRRTT